MNKLKYNKKIIKSIYIIFPIILTYIFFNKILTESITINNNINLNVNKNETSIIEEEKLKIGYSYPTYGKILFEEGLITWLNENIDTNYELYYYELDYNKGKEDLKNNKIDLFFSSSDNSLIYEKELIHSETLYFTDYYALFEKNQSQELNHISNNVELLKGKNIIVIKEDGDIIEIIAKSSSKNASVYKVDNLKEAISKYDEDKENSIIIMDSFKIFDLLNYGYDLERIFPEYKISSATVQSTLENQHLIDSINDALKSNSDYFQNLNETIETQRKKEIFNSDNILNEKEKEWINNNNEITVKIIQYREPILFKDENENLQGFIVDVMNEFSRLTGITVKYEDYLEEFKKENFSFLSKLNDNEIYTLNFNTNIVDDNLLESYLDINSKIGIVHKESDIKSLSELYKDTKNPIGVLFGSPSQRYFDSILMKNYKVYYSQDELITDFNEDKLKYFSTLEMNFYEMKLNYEDISFFKTLESIRSFPMFLFNKNSTISNIFKKALKFINCYDINDYWQNHMNSKINEKANERFNKNLQLSRLNTFVITLAIMLSIIGLIFVDFSIKNKKQNKQLKNALSKLESTQKAKNLFFANMNHEIRTPIYTILGMNYFLKKSKNLNDNDKKYLNNIEVASNMLLNLVNDVLDYSKIEEKKINIEKKNFKLKELEDDILGIFSDRIKEKGLEFIIKSNYAEDLVIYSDKLKLSQVIVNLINNAFKFTEEGSITFTIEVLNNFEEETPIIFSVIDTGIGIDNNKLDIIWNDFEQIHNNLSENYSGTGLGLAISKRIVETLGGEVWVKSTIGKGSIFGFDLSVKKGNLNSLILDDYINSSDDLTGKKILIVEDNIINLEIALAILQELGVHCDTATNGEEAIECCKKKNNCYYDLILMDINMPKLNGYDAVKALRDVYNIKSPIAFMTATFLDKSKEIEFKDYSNGVILKPINPDNIKEKILKLIKKTV